MSFPALNLSLGTHHDAATTSLIGILHPLQAIDIRSSGEVRTRDIFHQSIGIDVWIVYISAATINHLTEVMGRHIGGHTHGNTVTTVHQQVRNLRWHHRRLLQRVIEVVHHINGVFLQVIHDMLTHFGETALRITHGCGRVTIYRTEVTLSVNQCIAQVPVLCHTHQCSIDGGVAMWVILTKHLTDYACTFLIRLGRYVVDVHHTVQDTAVYWLKAITNIRKRTGYDDRHRVVDVRGFHLLLDVDFNNSVVVDCLIHFYRYFAFKGILKPANAFLPFIISVQR